MPFDNSGNVLYKYEYNLEDHLGNTRVVFAGHGNGKPELMQVTGYYPFGMVMGQQNHFAESELANNYLYNGKEMQNDELANIKLGWYDYGARFYDAEIGRWHVIDNKAEKYPATSPYTYALNNPILFLDPDGNDILIWYKNDQGKSASYRYTGGNVKHSNSFVNKVVGAYNYNVSNGGGSALKNAATDKNITIGIAETYLDSKSWNGNTYWNPENGLQTSEGDVLSPATILEHEVDHTYDAKKNPTEHEARIKEKDSNYTNAEEKRVITGNETKTAKANGEIGNKNVSRGAHHGNKKVIVDGGATSTKINQQRTNKFNKRLDDERNNWSSEW